MTFSSLRMAGLVGLALSASAPTALGQSAQPKPYSSGLIAAQDFRAGRLSLRPAQPAQAEGGQSAQPSCNPTPCVLPNVRASGGTQPVNEDAMTVNPTDKRSLITAGNDYNCGSLQGIFVSTNKGNTWTRQCMTPLPGASGLGDPVPAYDANGNAYIVGINQLGSGVGVIVVQKSTNNGTSFGAAAQAVPATLGAIADKPWLEADTSISSPRKNNLYVSVTQFANSNDSQISVSNSTNGGATWTTKGVSARQTFPDVVQFSDLATGNDGTVYLTYMKCRANGPTGDCGGTTATMLFQKSTDGGATWSSPVTMASVKMAPDSCGAFYGCLPNTGERMSNIPAIAVDNSAGPNSGKLYTVMYTFTGGRMEVQVVTSTDDGATWSTPTLVATPGAKGDQFLPWINVSPKTGEVGVTWLDRRNDAANLKYEAFAGFSPNGVSAYENVLLSTAQSDPNNDGFGGGFMGDYTGSGWAGKKLYMSYMDTRNGSVSQDWIAGAKR
jgi:hypothetical protein